MVIASGKTMHPIRAIIEGGHCTWFLTPANPVTARKKWIAGCAGIQGHAAHRCRRGGGAAARRQPVASGREALRRRLPARRCAVIIRDLDGARSRRGLVAYDADDAGKIIGQSSADIVSILGISGRTAIGASR